MIVSPYQLTMPKTHNLRHILTVHNSDEAPYELRITFCGLRRNAVFAERPADATCRKCRAKSSIAVGGPTRSTLPSKF